MSNLEILLADPRSLYTTLKGEGWLTKHVSYEAFLKMIETPKEGEFGELIGDFLWEKGLR